MLNKANMEWSGKKLYTMVTGDKVNFDNAVQRNLVWDDARKSLFIHSLIIGYPVPPFFAAKADDVFDMLDGKQRSNALASFMDDKYILGLDEDYREIMLDDGEFCNIEGKKFSELPEELRDRIKEFSFTIYYFDGITDDEIDEMFFRLNNGKALSAIELTRVKAKSFDTIKELAKHEIFDIALTEKAKNKYGNEDIVIKAYITIYHQNPSYTTKDIRVAMQSAEITDEQVDHLKCVFDKILFTYRSIQHSEAKIAKKMTRKTHLTSLTKLASSLDKDDLRAFVTGFFNGKNRAASVSESYNRACQYGSAKPEAVARRLNEMQDYYDTVIKTKKELDSDMLRIDDLPEIDEEDIREVG